MKFPTYKEFGEIVAKEALDTFEYNGKTLREWIEIISAAELGTNLAEVGTDLISRQAAIDEISRFLGYLDQDMINRIHIGLKRLPSAQPELDIWNDGTLHISVSKGQLDKIGRVLVEENGTIFCKLFYQDAEPERKTGYWILDRSGAYCCSKCMEPCAGYVMMKPRDKYCKMCGSRNEVME